MTELIITSSLLIIVIAALRYILRGKISPRLQYGLWALVLLRLLLPVSLVQSSLSIMNRAEKLPPLQTFESVKNYDAISYDNGFINGYAAYDTMRDSPVVINENSSETEFSRMKTAFYLSDILRKIWFSGIALFALAFVISNLRFSLRLRKTRRLLNGAAFEAESAPLRGCSLPVYAAQGLPSPCLYGVLRPAIYVSPQVLDDDETLSHILAHEQAHFRQGDSLWCLLRALCLCIYWFNPLVWLAAALSRRDSELACDDKAVSILGEEQRASYGKTLISLSCRRAGLLNTATSLSCGKRSLRERVTLIAKKPKPLFSAVILVVLIAALAVGCTFTGSVNPESPAPAALNEENASSSAAVNGDVISSYPQTVQDAAEDYARLCFEADSGDFPEYKLTKYRISNLLPVYIYKTDSGDLSVYRMDFQYFSAESQAVPYGSKLQDGWLYLNDPGSTYLIFDSKDKHLLTLSEGDCQPGSPIFTNDMNLLFEQRGIDIAAPFSPTVEEFLPVLGSLSVQDWADDEKISPHLSYLSDCTKGYDGYIFDGCCKLTVQLYYIDPLGFADCFNSLSDTQKANIYNYLVRGAPNADLSKLNYTPDFDEVLSRLDGIDWQEYQRENSDTVEYLWSISQAVIYAPTLTKEQCFIILSATTGLDGAYADAYASLVAYTYASHMKPFAECFNTMLSPEQQKLIYDFLLQANPDANVSFLYNDGLDYSA